MSLTVDPGSVQRGQSLQQWLTAVHQHPCVWEHSTSGPRHCMRPGRHQQTMLTNFRSQTTFLCSSLQAVCVYMFACVLCAPACMRTVWDVPWRWGRDAWCHGRAGSACPLRGHSSTWSSLATAAQPSCQPGAAPGCLRWWTGADMEQCWHMDHVRHNTDRLWQRPRTMVETMTTAYIRSMVQTDKKRRAQW